MTKAKKTAQKKTSKSSKPAKSSPIRLRWWSFYAIIVALTGLLGIQFLITRVYPSEITHIVLFSLIFVTAGAMVIPFSAYLNHRFAGKEWRKKDRHRLWRQSLEGAILMVVMAYLQRFQDLDWVIAGVLIGVFLLMETFFITRV